MTSSPPAPPDTNDQLSPIRSSRPLAAHFADAIDLETLKRHQDRIRAGLSDIDRRLASEHDHHTGALKQLSTALSLLVDCATLYARTNDQGKRLANQALTDGIEISEDERATIRLAEPFAALTPEPTSNDVRSSSTSSIVDLRGLEPLTPCMPCRCATSCATGPFSVDRCLAATPRAYYTSRGAMNTGYSATAGATVSMGTIGQSFHSRSSP